MVGAISAEHTVSASTGYSCFRGCRFATNSSCRKAASARFLKDQKLKQLCWLFSGHTLLGVFSRSLRHQTRLFVRCCALRSGQSSDAGQRQQRLVDVRGRGQKLAIPQQSACQEVTVDIQKTTFSLLIRSLLSFNTKLRRLAAKKLKPTDNDGCFCLILDEMSVSERMALVQ